MSGSAKQSYISGQSTMSLCVSGSNGLKTLTELYGSENPPDVVTEVDEDEDEDDEDTDDETLFFGVDDDETLFEPPEHPARLNIIAARTRPAGHFIIRFMKSLLIEVKETLIKAILKQLSLAFSRL